MEYFNNYDNIATGDENEIFNMYFGIIEDYRREVNVIHPLVHILKLVMIAVLCRMDELDKINRCNKIKERIEKNNNKERKINEKNFII